ncbi:MAG: hypothetical protein J6C82_01175 [Clostridia bacterium]|nr:hypothetical protein [Clostridia bacterium]
MKKLLSCILALCMMLSCVGVIMARDLTGYDSISKEPLIWAVVNEDGSAASDTNNIRVGGGVYGLFAYDISLAAGKTVGKAELSFPCSSYSDNKLYLYKITSSYEAWSQGVANRTAGEGFVMPTWDSSAIASLDCVSSQTNVIDVTDYVKSLAKDGIETAQIVAGTGTQYTVGMGNAWNAGQRPVLNVYYADAPAITVTSPEQTTLSSGSSVTFTAEITDSKGVSEVKMYLDDTELEVTNSENTYSAATEALEDGRYVLKVTATNTVGITSTETVTVLVGYEKTETELSVSKRGANKDDGDTKWNGAVTSEVYWYFAYDASALEDYTLISAEFKFNCRVSGSENLNFYEITSGYDEWAIPDEAAEGDVNFPAAPLPEVSETAFVSQTMTMPETDEDYFEAYVDITEYVENKLASGETMIQFAINTNQYRIASGGLNSLPVLTLTTSELLRPTVTPKKDYSYVSPNTDTQYTFTVDAHGAEISAVTAVVDGEPAELTAENGEYSLTAAFEGGEHTIEITAVNDAGAKRVYAQKVNAIDYEVVTEDIVISEGTASGAAKINSYTGVLDNAVVIMAVYDENNTMLDKTAVPYENLSKGETPVSASITVPSGAKTVKMFIWYNIEGLKPLCNAEVKGL